MDEEEGLTDNERDCDALRRDSAAHHLLASGGVAVPEGAGMLVSCVIVLEGLASEWKAKGQVERRRRSRQSSRNIIDAPGRALYVISAL